MVRHLSIFIFLLFCVSGLAKAQPGTATCLPDCFNNPFIAGPDVTFTIGGCRYSVDYYYRKACDTYCDILIWRVISIDPPPCGSMPINQLLNIATARTINYILNDPTLSSILNCGPTAIDDCSDYWRVSKASCWHNFTNSSYTMTKPPSILNYYGGISYCSLDACCFSTYRVCMDSLGQIVISQTGSTSTNTCPSQCTNVCED